MKKRVLFILGIFLALVCTFTIGAVAGGGVIHTWFHQVQPASAAQDAEPDPDAGLIVTYVEKDGPASRAGIVRGDILLSINGNEVNSMPDMLDILDELEAGDEVQLTILHGDEVRSLDVTLGEGPLGTKLGLTLCCGRPVQIEIERFKSDESKPMIVRVQKGSPAEEAGLQPGDLILSIDGREIHGEEDLSNLLREYEPGQQIELEIRSLREGESRSVLVELSEHPEIEDRAYLGIQVFNLPNFHLFRREGIRPEEFHFEFPPLDDEGFPFHPFYKDEWILPLTESGFEKGIIVVEVLEDAPASQSDLQEGDVITALDGEDMQGPAPFADAIREKQPGDEITLTIYRISTEETLDLQITLGEHPDDPDSGYLGIKIRGMIHIEDLDEDQQPWHWRPFFDRFRFPFRLEKRFHFLEPKYE